MNPEITGLAAGLLTMIASLPQAIKIIRTHKMKDLSVTMYLLLTTGLALWVIYGIQKDSLSLIAANGIGLVPNAVILFLLLKHKRK